MKAAASSQFLSRMPSTKISHASLKIKIFVLVVVCSCFPTEAVIFRDENPEHHYYVDHVTPEQFTHGNAPGIWDGFVTVGEDGVHEMFQHVPRTDGHHKSRSSSMMSTSKGSKGSKKSGSSKTKSVKGICGDGNCSPSSPSSKSKSSSSMSSMTSNSMKSMGSSMSSGKSSSSSKSKSSSSMSKSKSSSKSKDSMDSNSSSSKSKSSQSKDSSKTDKSMSKSKTDMSKPSSPSKKSKPSSNSKKSKPSSPSKSKPSSPSKMSKPSSPSKMSKPSSPSKMSKPSNPSKMSKPSSPSKMSKPSSPSKMSKPSMTTQSKSKTTDKTKTTKGDDDTPSESDDDPENDDPEMDDPKYIRCALPVAGVFGSTDTGGRGLEFFYQIETRRSINETIMNEVLLPLAEIGIAELVLRLLFRECQTVAGRRALQRRSLNRRSLQTTSNSSVCEAKGFSNAPADRVLPGVTCVKEPENSSNNCFVIDAGARLYFDAGECPDAINLTKANIKKAMGDNSFDDLDSRIVSISYVEESELQLDQDTTVKSGDGSTVESEALPGWAWGIIGVAVFVLLLLFGWVCCRHRGPKKEDELNAPLASGDEDIDYEPQVSEHENPYYDNQSPIEPTTTSASETEPTTTSASAIISTGTDDDAPMLPPMEDTSGEDTD